MAIPIQIVFVILKLTKSICWNWGYVLIPIMCFIISYGLTLFTNCCIKSNQQSKKKVEDVKD